ncbi:MAG: peptidylprolyl isomerase [Gemmatimonadetes bacterium]|nr:peptidylprolyl isomerase [Gemmatimonadota bacterium]
MKRSGLLWLAALAAFPAAGAAQEPAPPGDVVDRVLAVVGDSIVLQSEVDEELVRIAASGRPLPEDPRALDRLRRQILQSYIDELILAQAAVRDSVEIPAEQVNTMVDRDIAGRVRSFGSQVAMEQALRAEWRMTLSEFRDLLARQYRRSLLAQGYLEKVQRTRRPPPVAEAEVQAFFEENQERLGKRPATISFQQVVVAPQPSDSARASARALAEETLAKVRAGEDFAQLAKRYSDDPGSREKGGDLGWFRQGQMVKQFEEMAYRLRPGEVSGIVETAFGFHIIKLEKIKGGERQARHILFRPAVTDADTTRARTLAEDVAAQVRAGADIAELTRKHGDPSEEKQVEKFERERLPEPYATELASAKAGDVVGPIRLPGAGTDKWTVVKVMESTEAGEFTLEDVRVQVRDQLARQKLLEEVVVELRDRTHVEIRP